MSAHEELARAEREYMAAQNRLNAVKKKAEALEIKFREALSVGGLAQCKAAILPSGQVVVHVWVASSGMPNQLHIVEPTYLDEDANPRQAD